MSSRVIWLPRAKRNLDDQLKYLRTRNLHAALAIAQAVFQANARLALFPNIGRKGRKPRTCELVLAGTAFLIVYRVQSDSVVVLRFLHGAQRWPEADVGA